ncbi:MAG: hypothetical protein K0R29_2401 [Pseudobdellovibrio sp.]|jgi:hypothetical protein|nr:hypothetical protein [Pseudobdellovibrio sp.]
MLASLNLPIQLKNSGGQLKVITNPKEHLKSVGESYFEHGGSAISWGFFLLFTGLVLIVHGIFPFIFPFLPARNIRKINKKLDEREELVRDKD